MMLMPMTETLRHLPFWIIALFFFPSVGLLEEYRRVNEQESITIAEGILSRPFLQQQRDFLRSRGKDSQARMFDILDKTHFLWRRLV